MRSTQSDTVLLFDLRRRWFLCVDLSGELYSSVSTPSTGSPTLKGLLRRVQVDQNLIFSSTGQRLKDKDDCLFYRVWLDVAGKREVLYSVGGGQLLTLKAARRKASRTVVETLLGSSAGRKRRSHEVNPSDPLRSQPSHPATVVDQTEQDQAGAVSKETIASCDDPLRVLRPNAPGSPVKTNIADRAEHD